MNNKFSSMDIPYSTSLLPLDILAKRPPEKKIEWVSIDYRLQYSFVLDSQIAKKHGK